jgi:hypothetical protein
VALRYASDRAWSGVSVCNQFSASYAYVVEPCSGSVNPVRFDAASYAKLVLNVRKKKD